MNWPELKLPDQHPANCPKMIFQQFATIQMELRNEGHSITSKG